MYSTHTGDTFQQTASTLGTKAAYTKKKENHFNAAGPRSPWHSLPQANTKGAKSDLLRLPLNSWKVEHVNVNVTVNVTPLVAFSVNISTATPKIKKFHEFQFHDSFMDVTWLDHVCHVPPKLYSDSNRHAASNFLPVNAEIFSNNSLATSSKSPVPVQPDIKTTFDGNLLRLCDKAPVSMWVLSKKRFKRSTCSWR